MKISIACDHGGLALKNHLVSFLEKNGHEVLDFGTNSSDSCDYPDFAYKAAKSLANHEVERGIVICTTGIGASIVANKVRGVRCGLVTNVEDAELTRMHNNANCLGLGAKNVSNELAEAIVTKFLETEFQGGRHLRRVDKISLIEAKENLEV